jgi:hypothetical protein
MKLILKCSKQILNFSENQNVTVKDEQGVLGLTVIRCYAQCKTKPQKGTRLTRQIKT